MPVTWFPTPPLVAEWAKRYAEIPAMPAALSGISRSAAMGRKSPRPMSPETSAVDPA